VGKKKTSFWARGAHEEVKTNLKKGVEFVVEQHGSSNEVLLSSKGSYLRAACFLPFVVLEFGANKSSAISFQITYLSSTQIILATADRGHGVNTWVTHGEFVYLLKGAPSEYRHNKEAVLTIFRN